MLSDNQYLRIAKEVQLFKEAFPYHDIINEDLKIIIEGLNLKCMIKLPSNWPLYPPIVIIDYDNYIFYQPQINWNPIMDLRTIFNDVINITQNNSYKDFKRIESNIDDIIEFNSDKFYRTLRVSDINNLDNLDDLDDIDKLRKYYPNIKVDKIMKSKIIHLGDLEIIISKDEINVFENGNDWPAHMIPTYNDNTLEIVDCIFNTKQLNRVKNPDDYISKCQLSLKQHFDGNINYDEYHQTFIINSPKYLIIVGINVNSQYLSPMTMIYHKGTILGIQYDFSNWNPDNLGKIISNAIHNYELST